MNQQYYGQVWGIKMQVKNTGMLQHFEWVANDPSVWNRPDEAGSDLTDGVDRKSAELNKWL